MPSDRSRRYVASRPAPGGQHTAHPATAVLRHSRAWSHGFGAQHGWPARVRATHEGRWALGAGRPQRPPCRLRTLAWHCDRVSRSTCADYPSAGIATALATGSRRPTCWAASSTEARRSEARPGSETDGSWSAPRRPIRNRERLRPRSPDPHRRRERLRTRRAHAMEREPSVRPRRTPSFPDFAPLPHHLLCAMRQLGGFSVRPDWTGGKEGSRFSLSTSALRFAHSLFSASKSAFNVSLSLSSNLSRRSNRSYCSTAPRHSSTRPSAALMPESKAWNMRVTAS